MIFPFVYFRLLLLAPLHRGVIRGGALRRDVAALGFWSGAIAARSDLLSRKTEEDYVNHDLCDVGKIEGGVMDKGQGAKSERNRLQITDLILDLTKRLDLYSLYL